MILSVLWHISQLKQVLSVPSPCFGTVIQDPALILNLVEGGKVSILKLLFYI